MTLKLKKLVSVDSECAVSSVVEHYLDTVGVTGSNPVSRTILQLDQGFHPCLLLPKSQSHDVPS